ncbi:MAG: hypothetical protein IJ457_09535 [Clostridia bacterium]|nr:hypothetical protein [Clostridia bacterium]
MKKIFCILLASLLLITVAVSCADNKAEGQTTENTSEAVKTSVESTSTQEENPGETTTDDIGTTAVDTTEADTAEPEENIAVIPDESYVGKWVSYPAAASGNVVISNLNDKAVTFSLFIYKGFSIEATAIKYDNRFLFGEVISPDLRYDFYDSSFYKECKVSGSIVLAENKVEFIFDDPILNGMDVTFNIKYSSCMKYQETVNECLTVLDNSCWKNATEHPTDIVRYRWSSDASDKVWLDNAKPYATENSLIYSILGRSNYLSVVVRVVYDREADDWFAADVFYAHNDGRVLQGDELKAFMLNHGKTDFILPADDVDLLEYFK